MKYCSPGWLATLGLGWGGGMLGLPACAGEPGSGMGVQILQMIARQEAKTAAMAAPSSPAIAAAHPQAPASASTVAAAGSAHSAPAPPTRPPAAAASGCESSVAPGESSSWPAQGVQSRRYKLGAGDVLQIGLLGKPQLSRTSVPVAPDGTLSYLQAKRVQALGRTIDELRAQLEERLAPYYRDPQILISTAQLGSQRYTVLGEVRQNGTFPLARPTPLLEAIARAGGFQVGSFGENSGELADLRRSFIVRRGRRLDVDLEALFLRADFAQNILLEPGDYIHIASLIRNEIYVLGRVRNPGAYPMRNGITVTGAIAAAQGLAPEAWRNRVLVVRGRMHQPETHVVELNRAIHGRSADLQLEPGDLVFVSTRPWSYASQVLDSALAAYIDGTVAGLLATGTPGFSVGPSY